MWRIGEICGCRKQEKVAGVVLIDRVAVINFYWRLIAIGKAVKSEVG